SNSQSAREGTRAGAAGVCRGPGAGATAACRCGSAAARHRAKTRRRAAVARFENASARGAGCAEQNDRDAFKAALADARSAAASYPPGGERDAASDVIGVYNDLEKLWDYSFESPTGAFFDAGTEFVGMMRRYSDYPRFIRDSTLTVAGQ